MELVRGIRHADFLPVTGTVNALMKDRMVELCEQIPELEHLVATGACALGGGVVNTAFKIRAAAGVAACECLSL